MQCVSFNENSEMYEIRYIVVGEHSVGLIESTYNATTWNHLLDQIGKHFDRKKPICPAKRK